jgi:hypothetical protein
MRKRALLLLGLLASLVLLGFFVVEWLTTPPPGINHDNAIRIREGMTLDRVEKLMGRAGEKQVLEGNGKETGMTVWHGDGFSVGAIFDKNGKLEFAEFNRQDGRNEGLPIRPTLIERVRLLLRL